MNKQQLDKFEQKLWERGYKKITSCKATQSDDYEYYKAFYDNDKEYPLQYQIFFEFWDFSIYKDRIPDEENWYKVSITIMPESCKNNVGRRDLSLSVDWDTNIEKVEKVAQKFYEFLITEVD